MNSSWVDDVIRDGSQLPSSQREITVSIRRNSKGIKVKKRINLGFTLLAQWASHPNLKNSRAQEI